MSAIITAIASRGETAGNPGLQVALRRLVGPGLLVAVGYVDPGNWATDIAGGTSYGYSLLTVVVLASLLAMAIQSLVVRVTVATGEDLASLTARLLPRPVALLSWLAGEAAILATALAELVGGAIALRLLTGLSLETGLAVTAAATLTVMQLSKGHVGLQEKLVGILLAIVALSFVALLVASRPDAGAMARDIANAGTVLGGDTGALLIGLGILGATIMPHNLYLHSGLLAERLRGLPAAMREGRERQALRAATGDTLLSLGLAMLVNAAILIVAAASLGGATVAVASLDDAHAAMQVVLGGVMATLFALALYAAGQSSAITGVLAGRMLTRGFRGRESKGWLRGIVTRVVAVAIGFTLLTRQGGQNPDDLLVLSQVVLSLALPFALAPLAVIAARREVMGRLALGRTGLLAIAAITLAIIGLDIYLLADTLF